MVAATHGRQTLGRSRPWWYRAYHSSLEVAVDIAAVDRVREGGADLDRLPVDAEDSRSCAGRGRAVADVAAASRRSLGVGGWVVDVVVAATADALAAHGPVEVVTSGANDLSRLREYHDGSFALVAL